MKKITLYRLQAEYLYGDDREEKRAKQLQVVASLGLQESAPGGSVFCTTEQLLQLFKNGYCGDYMRQSDFEEVATVDAGPDVEGLFSILADKIASMPAASMNEKCGQHQPNNALLAVAETKLLQDSCTDVLQEELAAGWRILAIQPQPDQRRPDYILGRSLMSAMR